jgi:predicted nucleotidyltransferase
LNISIDQEKIQAFCRRWHISELALFGSVLREDFRPDSDVDVLLRFAPDSPYSILFNHTEMEEELRQMIGRNVDLVSKQGVEQSKNARRREEILQTAEVIYAQAA